MMERNVIEVENLSKSYRIGQFNTGALSQDIERWFRLLLGKEDPFTKIEDDNDRTKKATGNIVRSLNDINFQVRAGEILGIVGRNGAGKSTLLKILSRVTTPTTGQIKIKGKVASLLEVGTGFHPELTGKENVFLNGAILGMKKAEIKSKFDEIVAFAGVERYIDTPVKRYSSGMYVRLAFAVAAHLEPDILIVDEVLAVGDIEFQKKCLGKMQEVSDTQNRTILFVSHNMSAIRALCDRTIVLDKGLISMEGNTHEAISHYLKLNEQETSESIRDRKRPSRCSLRAKIVDVKSVNQGFSEVDATMPINIEMVVESTEEFNCSLQFIIADDYQNLAMLNSAVLQGQMFPLKKGENRFICKIQPLNLYSGTYKVHAELSLPAKEVVDYVEAAVSLTIPAFDPYKIGYDLRRDFGFGHYHVDFKWKNLD